MTRDDILRMAHQAGLCDANGEDDDSVNIARQLERFAALRAALAQQAEPVQEPVGQLQEAAFGRGQVMWFDKPADGTKLYTAPPQRLPLTEEEIDKIFKHLCNTVGASYKTMARAVERAHGIKE